MLEIVQIGMVIMYSGMLLFIFCYSVMQANLVYNYVRKTKDDTSQIETELSTWPMITVQLPIYNEKYVVERLIDCIVKFDYPSDKFEIQVLDDSDDETAEIVAKKVADLKTTGCDIKHIRRPDRVGYKAGALAYGLRSAKGIYVAIFDADFLPHADFLKKTIPHFNKENIGVVQTRWEHLNEEYSLLTKLQAFGLDAHFSVEQVGRNCKNHFINFNGTAGVWRANCIADAGGWQSDTLTEDLDLSYRAQLRGWRFKFLEEVGSPAELPAAMPALKSQQFRWTKGAAQCAKKNLLKVFKSNDISGSTKIHALFHLMNSFLFVCIFATALLSIPLLLVKESNPELGKLFKYGSLFLSSLLTLSVFYWVSRKKMYAEKGLGFIEFIIEFPLFLSVSMGLSLHNAIAVIEGYIGKTSPFIRTPKFNITDDLSEWKTNSYVGSSLNLLTILEGFLSLYFLGGIVLAYIIKDYGLLPFHLMLSFGFGTVFFYSIRHSYQKK